MLLAMPAQAQVESKLEKQLIAKRESAAAVYERFSFHLDRALLVDEQELHIYYKAGTTRFKSTLTPAKQAALPTSVETNGLLWREAWLPVQIDTMLDGRIHEVRFTSPGGELIEIRDLNVYHQGPDTAVQVRTFLPDPLTPYGYTYGGSYVDMNDQNGSVLDSLTVLDTLGVDRSSDTALLQNNYARLVDFDAPYISISKDADRWTLGRSEPEFEQVSALYHITRMRQYLERIGYGNLMTYRIDVDAQAMNGQDNSMFNFGYTPPRLYFGEGGVDDAEDADVVVHELGHALSHAAAPFSNSGVERRTFDEAVSDYFAERYGRLQGITSPRVFEWDGNNAFWSGRAVSYDGIKDYDNLVFTGIYQHTDLISSAMLELSAALPDSLGDVLVLEVLYNLMPQDGLDDISEEFLVVDNALNNGANHNLIFSIFDGTRNLLNQQSTVDLENRSQFSLVLGDEGLRLSAQSAPNACTVEVYTWNGQLLHVEPLKGETHDLPKGAGVVRVVAKGKTIFSSVLPL